MYDYSTQITSFRDAKIRLTQSLREILFDHRKSNRDRLESRLSKYLPRTHIGTSNFKPQGSVAMQTVIQTNFVDEEYDIDDGLVIPRSHLVDDNGEFLDASVVLNAVMVSLEDRRFKRQPELRTNCVRVFYAAADIYKHHVDFPVYRYWTDPGTGEIKQELAGDGNWLESNPTQVNSWFEDLIRTRNAEVAQWGTQARQLVQYLKRYCRSREAWLDELPNGMKLTMLVVECQPAFVPRIDQAFRHLLERLEVRLHVEKRIWNLAHSNKPLITRTANDANVESFLQRVSEALRKLETLDRSDANTESAAREVWDWMLQTDGYFDSFDAEKSRSDSIELDIAASQVPWQEPLPWPLAHQATVQIHATCQLRTHGGSCREFSSEEPLPKGMPLRFRALTNARTPYQVLWQVVNTGQEALVAGCSRGEIFGSASVGAGGLWSTTVPELREESTLYRGRHWIECFILKDGICVGRSGPFFVVVE